MENLTTEEGFDFKKIVTIKIYNELLLLLIRYAKTRATNLLLFLENEKTAGSSCMDHEKRLLEPIPLGIGNKPIPLKFDKLLLRIQALNIDTEERLAEVIRLFFEKVIMIVRFIFLALVLISLFHS